VIKAPLGAFFFESASCRGLVQGKGRRRCAGEDPALEAIARVIREDRAKR
jgi:hypothetical protein